jgi:transposase
LLPHLRSVLVERVERVVDRAGHRVRLMARSRAEQVPCPRCGTVSGRVHGRYRRQLVDAAIAGAAVVLDLLVRRFRCQRPDCAVVTFAEQVPGLTSPHARFTPAAEQVVTSIGMALAGRAGARLAVRLGVRAGRDTMLRRVRAVPEPPVGPIPVLGVDDFAVRRGHVYGTVIVDIERRRPVDVLAGRDSEPLRDWLRGHPGVQVICRDRAGAYAEAARTGAPDAVQVADRFHLWQNLGKAVEKTVAAHRDALREPPADNPADNPGAGSDSGSNGETACPAGDVADDPADDPAGGPAGDPAGASTGDGQPPPMTVALPQKAIVVRTRQRYADVQDLLTQGASRAQVARRLGLDPHTVRRFANASSVEELLVKTDRASKIDPFKEHLHTRWNAGLTDAARLTTEITALGYAGSEQTVRRYVRRFRDDRPAPPPGPVPPTVRDVTRWIMTRPDRLDPDDQTALKTVLARSAELDRLTGHVQDFATMLTKLEGHRLDAWIAAVEADTLTPLTRFGTGLRTDLAAVTAGLTLPHNSGPVEGTVNKIKMIKRQMYGRANLDLLRKRVIHPS